LLKNYNATDENVELDLSLARGLSYYTGCIFEVKINNVGIGSVSGGGRYDDLTGNFGLPDVSGVGFSFGVDRLYDALEELNNFPKEATSTSTLLLCHFDEASFHYGLGILTKVREAGIAAEIYPDQAKLKKQLDFGNKKQIPFTLVIGSDELKSGNLVLKNMETGEQESHTQESLITKLR
jgi:histidyl-tRNA synthetase